MNRKKGIIKEGPGAGVDFKIEDWDFSLLNKNMYEVLSVTNESGGIDYELIKDNYNNKVEDVLIDLTMESYYDQRKVKTTTDVYLTDSLFFLVLDDIKYYLSNKKWQIGETKFIKINIEDVVLREERRVYSRGYTRSSLDVGYQFEIPVYYEGYVELNDSNKLDERPEEISFSFSTEGTILFVVNEEIKNAYDKLDSYDDEIFESKRMKKESPYDSASVWPLQKVYDHNYEDFLQYQEMYGVFDRLNDSVEGVYGTPEEMWDDNPNIHVTNDPSEFKIVDAKPNEIMDVEPEMDITDSTIEFDEEESKFLSENGFEPDENNGWYILGEGMDESIYIYKINDDEYLSVKDDNTEELDFEGFIEFVENNSYSGEFD